MKVALGVEYDGSRYCGWQVQKGVATVQSHVEASLSKVADEPITCHCAGRTDAGVHAIGQVVHIETRARRTPRSWVFGCNTELPPDISITWAAPVDDDFHARFSATGRSYRYVIFNRAARPGVLSGRVTWECRPLTAERMRQAARHLVGEHDFSSYRAQGCQAKSPVRTVRRLEVSRAGPLITIEIEANAFLHHMVRNIAGVLMAIGMGKEDPDWSLAVLQARERALGGVTAPPDGLYLTRVCYPARYGLPVPETLSLSY